VWSRYPLAGIAVVTGDGLVVADVERDAGAPAELISVDTARARSAAGGAHFFFETTKRVQTRRRGETGFGDLLAEGTYVVVPPADGREWLRSPFDGPLASLPDSLSRPFLEEAARADQPTSHVKWVGEGTQSEENALEAARLIGLDVRSLGCVTCPFHADRSPSAGLILGHADDWILSCRACDESWSLPKVYACIRGGADGRPPTIAKWARLLDHKTGAYPLPEIAVELPSGPESARKVADGYLLLFRIDLEDPRSREVTLRRGVPFTRKFGAPWCEITEYAFDKGRGHLIETGWFAEPTYEVIGGRRTMVLLPRGWAR
jgi:hypothetical protein